MSAVDVVAPSAPAPVDRADCGTRIKSTGSSSDRKREPAKNETITIRMSVVKRKVRGGTGWDTDTSDSASCDNAAPACVWLARRLGALAGVSFTCGVEVACVGVVEDVARDTSELRLV